MGRGFCALKKGFASMNWYLVDDDLKVINCIVYDGIKTYLPPDGLQLRASEEIYHIGDTFGETK